MTDMTYKKNHFAQFYFVHICFFPPLSARPLSFFGKHYLSFVKVEKVNFSTCHSQKVFSCYPYRREQPKEVKKSYLSSTHSLIDWHNSH